MAQAKSTHPRQETLLLEVFDHLPASMDTEIPQIVLNETVSAVLRRQVATRTFWLPQSLAAIPPNNEFRNKRAMKER